MNKLRGYRKFTKDSSTRLEQGDSYTQGLVYDQHVQQKQRNMVFRQLFGGARSPLFTWVSGVVMIGVFIYEIVRNHELSGSWIMTNPFNPMVGPNYMALITMGSKFVPCMREIQNYSPATVLGNCYSSLEATCSVEQVCGFGGFRGTAPSQGFRFFTAIFIHAGVVHILMNLVTHFQTGAEVERALGLIRYMILYIVSGIWGFILSAVLAGPTVSSMGCSGALFGIIGYTVIDHLMQWKQHRHPRREFMRIVIVIVISLVLGLLPGLDNFAHIGGLLMGLLLGITLAPFNRHASRRATVIIWTVKILSFVLVIILYAILLSKFYSTTDLSTVCPNCKYLSCLPVNGWCDNV
ncbi:hypothetical protein BDF20DRAFT_813874 [Mycotypha africana]|uniref:uncharacterized protein n=1 Tax=Mycotypha africana TaxID=64632 RepID=UPI0022FFEA29|nr:uncharacterized protein BDF20DRAFT_813874 [Mycotypha africana]KAI8988499.1 hypothetical protein BDF20DRAFT_813874 [Mycotypha africana]